MKSSVKLFALNFVGFFIIVANTRAFTQGQYFWTAITDLVHCLLAFTIMKGIASSQNWRDRVGYALGGTTGSLVAIYVSKAIYGA